jgi:hypothetical protein
MNESTRPSALERITGSVAVEGALTVAAALAAGPLAPLLPVLTKSLAAERQRTRLESTLTTINAILSAHEAQIRDLTDEQYKIINEAVLATLTTTEAEKLSLLRNAVKNAITVVGIAPQESVLISRVIRDISAQEARFLVAAFGYESVEISGSAEGAAPDRTVLRVLPDSVDALSVSGFVSLGLLAPPESSWDGIGRMRFTRIAAKVLALLRPDA